MVIIKRADFLTGFISQKKQQKKSIGFVPTMGALHDGHISLVRAAQKENDLTVCSIFINPTQFNNADDFKNYPVSIEDDIVQLIAAGADVLFLPVGQEIYPDNFEKQHFNLGEIEFMLEGKYRPGHFQGVCQVVDRLLQIVNPDVLYLGQKDLQQCHVIKKLIEITDRDKKLRLNISPTIREEDGLALSSRNRRLSPEERKKATAIFKALNFMKENLTEKPVEELMQSAKAMLQEKDFNVDYVEVVDAGTLQPQRNINKPVVGVIAASIGKVRLIDNMPLNFLLQKS